MEREAEQKRCGKHCSDPMSGNIHQPVGRKKNYSNQGCEPITLIGSFPQRKNFPNDEEESDDDKNNRDPTKLGPKPEPIAFGMNRAAVAVRSCPKNCEDVFKITKTDSDPGRVANQLKNVGKNPPPKIARDAGVGEIAEMKSFERLSAKKQQSGEQEEQERNDKRDPRRRALAEREDAEPERASGDENAKAGAREIQNDRGNHQGERHDPKDPPFAAFAKIVLTAGQNHHRGQAKKVPGLIAIRKRPEVAFVVPEGRRRFCKPEQNANRSQNNNAGGEQPQLLPRFAQFELLSADDVKPAQASDETAQTRQRDPGLRT